MKKFCLIFSSLVEDEIPQGTNVKILTNSKPVLAKITNFYDGYYSAKVEYTRSVKLGSKVIILD